ncbi:TIR domain-containing protein [Aeromicrobium sp. Root236]|uniref:TIR domain-containing protein n=1 Tax=Aeromicrobium sp. Root236 TaxID=1736498 RepID=UPI00138F924E|nr:nucleotide-binding protein [Aeromicrobium sp. Root236]
MDTARKIALLRERIDAADNGAVQDWQDWRERTDAVVRQILGPDSTAYRKFTGVKYSPSMYTSGTDFRPYQRAGVQKACTIIDAAIYELELAEEMGTEVAESDQTEPSGSSTPQEVFIVHGHDEATKLKTKDFLRDLTGREPVILNRKTNRGRTLIEKFENHASTAAYAVILATADDVGRSKRELELTPRARQNVVFEMGYFFAALGRARVAVLYDEGIEEVGDIRGLVYIALDHGGAWKNELAKEIEDAGMTVNWEAFKDH